VGTGHHSIPHCLQAFACVLVQVEVQQLLCCVQLAQRLGGLPSKARAAADEIIADDPSMRPVAADGHSIPVCTLWLLSAALCGVLVPKHVAFSSLRCPGQH
jgi:hypothetical protein